MVDVFLIVATVVTFLILLVAGLYLLVYFQHPDDKWDAYAPKLVVITGFVIACATVLLLPLDVANNEGYAGCDGYDTRLCGGLNMELFWDIFYWLIPIYVFILIPFSTFYYEADDGMLMAGTSVGAKPNSRICEALKYQLVTTVVFGLIFGLCYLFLNDTDIPVREFTQRGGMGSGAIYTIDPQYDINGTTAFSSDQLADMGTADAAALAQVARNSTLGSIQLQVNVSTYFAGLMAFIGWWFFAIFGGIGLSSLPLDLILDFVNRPRHMDAVEYAEAQLSLRERVNELVDLGELIKMEEEEKEQGGANNGGGWFNRQARLKAREDRKTVMQFKQAVFLLEKDVEDFQNCTANYGRFNPLIPFFALIFGLCGSIVSLFWILHIILYVLPNPPIDPFLNTYFRWFDGWFPLFGVLSVLVFSFYLLICAVKGCFKFGLRFPGIIHLHPMKKGKTYMSSFLFNIALILLCSLPVVQFCVDAFSDYARYSTVYQVFGTQIRYLKFFKWFWTNNVFVYAFLVISLLTSLYLACRPRDTSANSLELRDRLRARRA
mmetsp:Transcript_4613/g.6310  ORF Transcript_4613/g.6310 Transcript_4613/m.6310 type:complete len:548 (-) Transcript_4613:238-1881(-)|eukprot:CAMPEP_0185736570 /NCGR_PEP_ID=MMETSP1171-20130828/28246_1 /TAXON_ID=374046 /ORGANISM="Helicotheca tamensis, Strain CCMP826" /LENGTH=547 /DNA_ID=CAMNT_0028407231 /DNA_START=131 /DNA_END=1774 /DNA_ORIENTATION=-